MLEKEVLLRDRTVFFLPTLDFLGPKSQGTKKVLLGSDDCD